MTEDGRPFGRCNNAGITPSEAVRQWRFWFPLLSSDSGTSPPSLLHNDNSTESLLGLADRSVSAHALRDGCTALPTQEECRERHCPATRCAWLRRSAHCTVNFDVERLLAYALRCRSNCRWSAAASLHSLLRFLYPKDLAHAALIG